MDNLFARRGNLCAAVPIPDKLRWWRAVPGGKQWLDRLPTIIEDRVTAWKLSVGQPFEGGNAGWVAPADFDDGRSGVLKINFPEPESEWESRSRVLERRESRQALGIRCPESCDAD